MAPLQSDERQKNTDGRLAEGTGLYTDAGARPGAPARSVVCLWIGGVLGALVFGQHACRLKVYPAGPAREGGQRGVRLVEKGQETLVQHKHSVAVGTVQGRAFSVNPVIVHHRFSGRLELGLAAIAARQPARLTAGLSVIQHVAPQSVTLGTVHATVGPLAGMVERGVPTEFEGLGKFLLALETNEEFLHVRGLGTH